MTLLVDGTALAPTESHAPPSERWRECRLFGLLTLLYFTVGAVLMLRYNIFEGDGASRVANASFTLFSRHPHLSALGFVWNPLPGMVEIPILELSRWWPELRTHGLAGALQSALFTAGAALMIRRIAFDRGVGDFWRRAAIAGFALNPVIVAYGGSGMSEAGMVFCLLWCTRRLLRWVGSAHIGDLAWAGIALGCGYLVRYEMVPAAAGAMGLVVAVTLTRYEGRARIDAAVLSALIAAFPIAVAVLLWALAGWVINGELFAQLSSRYGNAAQVDVARAHGYLAPAWPTIAQRLFAMQPFVGIAALVALTRSVLTRSADALVPLATFGTVLAFSVWGQHSGTTFGFVRYYVAAIPMVIVVALACWRPAPAPSRPGAVLISLSVLVAIPVTAASMLNPVIGNHQLLFGISSLLGRSGTAAADPWFRRLSVDERLIADYLDRKSLPEGSVLTDTFTTWGLAQASENPRQFVITSDYDFGPKLNRPWATGVRYIVITHGGNATLDAINQRYPTMWTNGAGIADLVYSGRGAFGQEQYRIYRVHRPIDEQPPPR